MRLQESFEPLGVDEIGVHPEVVSLGGHDDRHTVVDFFRELVGLGDDDGTGIDVLAFPCLVFPEPANPNGSPSLSVMK
jgi:hypothetical protein